MNISTTGQCFNHKKAGSALNKSINTTLTWARPYGSGYLAVSFGAGSSILPIGQNNKPQKDTAAYPSRKPHAYLLHPGECSSVTCVSAQAPDRPSETPYLEMIT